MKTVHISALLCSVALIALIPKPSFAQTGNTAYGSSALSSITTGSYNSAFGNSALKLTNTGDSNTAMGIDALYSNTSGYSNVAIGPYCLYSNTTGGGNIAIGNGTMSTNTTGSSNTAIGWSVLAANTTGILNTGIGISALYSNTAGYDNIAIGYYSQYHNDSGANNVIIGDYAFYQNIDGNNNTGFGVGAVYANTDGSYNVGVGDYALDVNTTGNYNIALGHFAGSNLTTGDNNIDVGNPGVADEADTIRIGDQSIHTSAFVAGIWGTTIGSEGVPVFVDSNGQLGTVTSSRRFKKDIADMGVSSEAILSLRPVSFHYKQEMDPKSSPHYGLVAEEVAEISPDLVIHDKGGDIYSVRYEAVNAMLLNEFQKEYKRVQAQERTIASQQQQLEQLARSVAELKRQIERPSSDD